MEKVKTEIIYVGNNISQWLVKDYIVSEHRGDWQCSCSIKYKRNPKLNCKHMDLVKAFLLDPKERENLEIRIKLRLLNAKLKELSKKSCEPHIFLIEREKGAVYYICNKCNSKLTLEEYKYYRRKYDLN